MMESIECPVPDCTYATPANTDAIVVAALLNAHATSYHSRDTSAKVEKVKRPTISTAGSSEECAYFKTRWDDYKTATKVTDAECVVQLLECCDETLRKDLTRSAGGSLTSKSEAEVLSAIRTLSAYVMKVVQNQFYHSVKEITPRKTIFLEKYIYCCTLEIFREENTMVARVALHNTRQDRDEPVRNFGARLRSATSRLLLFLIRQHSQNLNFKKNQITKSLWTSRREK